MAQNEMKIVKRCTKKRRVKHYKEKKSKAKKAVMMAMRCAYKDFYAIGNKRR